MYRYQFWLSHENIGREIEWKSDKNGKNCKLR